MLIPPILEKRKIEKTQDTQDALAFHAGGRHQKKVSTSRGPYRPGKELTVWIQVGQTVPISPYARSGIG